MEQREINDKFDKPKDKIKNIIKDNKPGYCEIGMSHCVCCGWQGDYPVSGCPVCHNSFTN